MAGDVSSLAFPGKSLSQPWKSWKNPGFPYENIGKIPGFQESNLGITFWQGQGTFVFPYEDFSVFKDRNVPGILRKRIQSPRLAIQGGRERNVNVKP